MSPGSEGSSWDVVEHRERAEPPSTALRELDAKVEQIRRDTDRCQDLLKFCSRRLNLPQVSAVRVQSGSGVGLEVGEQWKMSLIPGVPLKRQVKRNRRWKSADCKGSGFVQKATAAGAFEPHGSVAKARAKEARSARSGARLPAELS